MIRTFEKQRGNQDQGHRNENSPEFKRCPSARIGFRHDTDHRGAMSVAPQVGGEAGGSGEQVQSPVQ
jgi:hypothetical protein